MPADRDIGKAQRHQQPDAKRRGKQADANGCGLVAVDVDGQVVQLLATLTPDERARGIRVHSGDTVRIAEVDAFCSWSAWMINSASRARTAAADAR